MSRLIRVRAVEEFHDNSFFYIGYSRYPGKEAVLESLAKARLYRPSKLHRNDDKSLTVEFHQSSFGFVRSERQQKFGEFFADIVVPRLVEAASTPVEIDEDIYELPLQEIDSHRSSANPNEVRTSRIFSIGSMSLFSPEAELMLLNERKRQEAHTAS